MQGNTQKLTSLDSTQQSYRDDGPRNLDSFVSPLEYDGINGCQVLTVAHSEWVHDKFEDNGITASAVLERGSS